MRKRKASLHITLVLIGAAGLGACGRSDEQQMRRDMYASLADCKADWSSEQNCERVEYSGSGHGASGTTTRYYGPSYYGSGSSSGFSAPPRGSRAIGTQTISRGGFGGSSAFHSSGG